jgi:phospholipase/carboxylesterase
VEVETGSQPRASVIWLHGLGADGHDFEPIVPQLGLPGDLPVRFVFPHAPVRPVTLNGGYPMRAWFDIASLDRNAAQDAEGIAASCRQVEALLAREVERGVAAGHIVLAGFSQGGAIALAMGLRYPERLAGVMGLSTFIPEGSRILAEKSAANQHVPIFLAHGSLDPVVAPALGDATREMLQGAGYDVEWHSYPMPHAVCPDEIVDIGRWLVRVLGNAG